MLNRINESLPAGGALPLDLVAGGGPLCPEGVNEVAADAPHAAFVRCLVARLQELKVFLCFFRAVFASRGITTNPKLYNVTTNVDFNMVNKTWEGGISFDAICQSEQCTFLSKS